MFTPSFRLLLLMVLSVAAIFLAMAGRPFWLLMASVLSLFILWDYINRSTVPLALRRLAGGRYKDAHHLLRHVKNPNKLNRSSKAYYHFIQGMYHREINEFEEAATALEKANEIGISNKNFNAMNLIALADLAIIKKKYQEAQSYLSGIDANRITGSLKESVAKMQDYLKNAKKIN